MWTVPRVPQLPALPLAGGGGSSPSRPAGPAAAGLHRCPREPNAAGPETIAARATATRCRRSRFRS